ncbi:MAG: HD domain-containing protein [Pseudomonadota bacterium]
MIILTELEQQILEQATPLLKNGRPGDLEHTLRVVDLGLRLAAGEKADRGMIAPALLLHDIGWSQVDCARFLDAPMAKAPFSREALLHQEIGAEMAGLILEGLKVPPALVARITRYIAVHDQPDLVRAGPDFDARICFEADYLDRFGADGRGRWNAMMGARLREDHLRELLDQGREKWFGSPSALLVLKNKLEEL